MKKFFDSKIFRFIWSAALAVLLFMVCPPCFSKTTLIIILGILFVLINAADYIAKLTWLTHLARILVGGLFIFSGFIKANDPLGFSYKLKEYFEVFQADTGMGIFESFAHIALPLAILICASEIILGVMLLIGYRPNLTLGLLFAQIAFFTFLTFYSACYNKVTHCGCFGDFLPLKPWESFWKDVVLLVLITLLFAGKKNIGPVFSPMIVSTLFMLGIVFSFAFPIYTYRNLPIFDFRAYAPGLNIKDGMQPGPGYKPAVVGTLFKYENLKTGEMKEFNESNMPWEDTLTWKYVDRVGTYEKEPEQGTPAKITDFNVTSLNGDNLTDSLLNEKKYSFWLIMHELKSAEDDETLMAQINDFYKLATQEGYTFIALTASGAKEIDDFKHLHNALYDFATVDNIVLKTMIRSNPGLMLMKNGTVVANWHHHNFPSFGDVKQKLMK